MLGAAAAALSYGKHDKDAPSPLANRTIRVEREDHPLIGDIYEKLGSRVTFSRLRRGEAGPITRPSMSDTLDPGDLLTVVGPRELVARVATELGHSSSHSLLQDRSYLDFRRMTVSDPTSKMKKITEFFGDSARGLSDVNPVALGIGMALGILLGELKFFTPTGEYFSIGSAAGTLIIGLIFGKIGRVGPIVTAIPYTACQVLSEFGLLVFLAQAGAVAGGQIIEAFTSGAWWKIFLLGVIITLIMAIGMYCSMRWIFKMGGTRLAGVLAGSQTQPAVLAFANGRTNMDPRVALGYALVYPVAMIGKIMVAQVFGAM